jgi:hypothetical protein
MSTFSMDVRCSIVLGFYQSLDVEGLFHASDSLLSVMPKSGKKNPQINCCPNSYLSKNQLIYIHQNPYPLLIDMEV